ncbi:MAG: hypothetical protein ACHQK8_02670 [Bacteroidia bacterium]
MKKYFFIGMVLLVSCKRDNEVQQSLSHCTPDNKYILAGVPSKCLFINDFNPDITIEILDQNSGQTPVDIDIDKDNINDIRFDCFSVSQQTIIHFYRLNHKFNFKLTQLKYGLIVYYVPTIDSAVMIAGDFLQNNIKDTLPSKNGYWLPSDSTHEYNSRTYRLVEGGGNMAKPNQDIADQFIPIMYVYGLDSLYGWIHFSLQGGYLIIHDCAIQQKY